MILPTKIQQVKDKLDSLGFNDQSTDFDDPNHEWCRETMPFNYFVYKNEQMNVAYISFYQTNDEDGFSFCFDLDDEGNGKFCYMMDGVAGDGDLHYIPYHDAEDIPTILSLYIPYIGTGKVP